MPHYLKSVGNDDSELVFVEYPDSPRYEVRVYFSAVPHDHRTFIATDSVTDADAIYRAQAAQL